MEILVMVMVIKFVAIVVRWVTLWTPATRNSFSLHFKFTKHNPKHSFANATFCNDESDIRQ